MKIINVDVAEAASELNRSLNDLDNIIDMALRQRFNYTIDENYRFLYEDSDDLPTTFGPELLDIEPEKMQRLKTLVREGMGKGIASILYEYRGNAQIGREHNIIYSAIIEKINKEFVNNKNRIALHFASAFILRDTLE